MEKLEHLPCTAPKSSMVFYYSVLDNVYDMLDDGENPEFILKYIISILETGLCEGTQITDKQIKRMCKTLVPIITNSREKYQDRIDANLERQFQDKRLEDIMEYISQGRTQKDIADLLNISQGEVSKRISWAKKNNLFQLR